MIAWPWLLLTLFLGAALGVLAIALCVVGKEE